MFNIAEKKSGLSLKNRQRTRTLRPPPMPTLEAIARLEKHGHGCCGFDVDEMRAGQRWNPAAHKSTT
jgi:hypothetical protein